MSFTTRLLSGLTAMGLALSLAACGGSDEAAPGEDAAPAGGEVNTDAPLYDELPAEIQEAGVIRVGSSIEYPPMEYFDTDGTTVLGFDKDLTDLLEAQLGVPFDWENGKFDGLITQLNSGRYDVLISAMTDTPERQREVDFVDYYMAGMVTLVQDGNPEGITGADDLCGRTVAAMRGGTQDQYVQSTLTPECEEAGKEPVQLLPFDGEAEALLQLKQGRADAVLQDYPVAMYNIEESGNAYEAVGEQVIANPLGIAVSKDDTELRDALQQAVQATMDDGSYQELIDEYDTPLGAIEESTINAGE